MGRGSLECRVCMKKSKNPVDLDAVFVKKPRTTYLEGYNICTQLNALLDDGLPKNLCVCCRNELETAYSFIEKAKDSDRKLRLKLGVHRITRSSKRMKDEPSSTQISPLPQQSDNEEDFDEIKTEFISCTKDPLEDSELENNENSEDEMDWVADELDDIQTDGFADEIPTAIAEYKDDDDDDDEDDKPLKELIEKEKQNQACIVPTSSSTHYDATDVFNDLPDIPDNYSSGDEAFSDKMVELVPEPATTPEAQIFPQGRYMCKICQRRYFTPEGLKAHMVIHMPKKKKVKRVRGPNKKKSKNKKKLSDEEDDEDDEAKIPKEANESQSEKKDDSSAGKGEEVAVAATTEAKETEGKKKRKSKTPKPKKMFPCGVCGKHMISASKLRYHMVMHTGEKDYLCTMCPKAYSTIYALKHHMRTHTGERPYECKFCGDKFTRPTTLKSHMRRHTGERPYGCDICGKRFIQHSSMTTHMKLNHMAKTISCPYCNKKYARQTDLNTHLLSHTGDKPFSCSLCPSRFIRQANLNKHMTHHHHSEKNRTSAPQKSGQSVEQKTDEVTIPQSQPQSEPQSIDAAFNNQFVESTRHAIEKPPTGPTTIQFAGNSMQQKVQAIPVLTSTNPQAELKPTTLVMSNQFAGQVMQNKTSTATTTTSNFSGPGMQQKINTVLTLNQYEVAQDGQQHLPPLPVLTNVRSLARTLKGQTVARQGKGTANSPVSDEGNNISHMNQVLPQNAAPQQRLQNVQQSIILAPPPRSTNNENSIPSNVNIAGIPGGIPTHSMVGGVVPGGSGGRGVLHIGTHGQTGSVEHLKGINPPVDNLTNLLGQVIDPDRIGRSVDEIIPWNWSNAS